MYTYSTKTSNFLAKLAVPCKNRQDFLKVSRLTEEQLAIWLKELSCRAVGSALKYINMYSTGKTGEFIQAVYRQLPKCAHLHDYDQDANAVEQAEIASEQAKQDVKTAQDIHTIYSVCGNKNTKYAFKFTVRHSQSREERKKILAKIAKEKSLFARSLKGKTVYQSLEIDDIVSETLIACYEWMNGKRTDRNGRYCALYRYAYHTARNAIRKESKAVYINAQMPTVTDEKAKEEGITHYIDYVAYSQNSNSETMSASDILNDVRNGLLTIMESMSVCGMN